MDSDIQKDNFEMGWTQTVNILTLQFLGSLMEIKQFQKWKIKIQL